jgi:hypothetical protein
MPFLAGISIVFKLEVFTSGKLPMPPLSDYGILAALERLLTQIELKFLT